MKLKAIVLDIDGTLLNSENEISLPTKEKLIEAQKQGIRVILASGRPTNGLLSLADELDMAQYGGVSISYNGASAYHVEKKETIVEQGIAVDVALDIIQHLLQFNVTVMIDVDDYLFTNDAFFDIQAPVPLGRLNIVEYESRGGNFKVCEVNDFSEVIKKPVKKILVAGNPDVLIEHADAMSQPFEKKTTTAFSAPHFFEFTDLGVDKAKTLEKVLSHEGIQKDEVIAFGDGQNDRTLIEFAGHGVAMGNAINEILEIADEVTKTNDEGGILEVLNRFF